MKRASFLVTISLLLSIVAYGQSPAVPSAQPPAAPAPQTTAPPKPAAPAPAASGTVPGGKSFAVIDFMSALTENDEGKKASERLAAESAKLQSTFQAKQKEGADLQTKLTTDKTLTEAQKAALSKSIDQVSTELTRMQEDFQKQMTDMQQQLLTPIADRVKKEVNAYAIENSFALVMDNSSQTDNIIYASPVADITTEIIRRVNAAALKAPAATAPAARPPGVTAPRPQGPPATPAKPPVTPATKAPPDLSR